MLENACVTILVTALIKRLIHFIIICMHLQYALYNIHIISYRDLNIVNLIVSSLLCGLQYSYVCTKTLYRYFVLLQNYDQTAALLQGLVQDQTQQYYIQLISYIYR